MKKIKIIEKFHRLYLLDLSITPAKYVPAYKEW